jgi:hypothetical protein
MYNFDTCSLPVQNVLVRLQVLCKFCTSGMKASGPLNSFSGLALCRHPSGMCRAIALEHFGACNARNPAGLAVMTVVQVGQEGHHPHRITWSEGCTLSKHRRRNGPSVLPVCTRLRCKRWLSLMFAWCSATPGSRLCLVVWRSST